VPATSACTGTRLHSPGPAAPHSGHAPRTCRSSSPRIHRRGGEGRPVPPCPKRTGLRFAHRASNGPDQRPRRLPGRTTDPGFLRRKLRDGAMAKLAVPYPGLLESAGDGCAGAHQLAVADTAAGHCMPVLNRPVPPGQPRNADRRQIHQAPPVAGIEAEPPRYLTPITGFISRQVRDMNHRTELRSHPGPPSRTGSNPVGGTNPCEGSNPPGRTNPCKIIEPRAFDQLALATCSV
jgi:hypothetical protein